MGLDEDLLTLERWDRAREAAQLRLARSLAERLAPRVRLVGLRTFAQGDQRRRVALFTHDPPTQSAEDGAKRALEKRRPE